jgi:hypothetical protein
LLVYFRGDNYTPNFRFLPSTVTEKNATKNILDGRKDGRTDVKQYTPSPFGEWGYNYLPWNIPTINHKQIRPQASYRYTILWVAFLDLSDSHFLFADLVGFYAHFSSHFSQQLLMAEIWYLVTSFNKLSPLKYINNKS